jgi:hypothetical protein
MKKEAADPSEMLVVFLFLYMVLCSEDDVINIDYYHKNLKCQITAVLQSMSQ